MEEDEKAWITASSHIAGGKSFFPVLGARHKPTYDTFDGEGSCLLVYCSSVNVVEKGRSSAQAKLKVLHVRIVVLPVSPIVGSSGYVVQFGPNCFSLIFPVISDEGLTCINHYCTQMGRTEEFLVELTLPEYPIEPPNASPEPPNPEPVKVSSFSTMNLPNPSSDSLPMPPPFSTSFGGYCHSYPENSSSTSLTTYSDYAPSPCHRSSTPDSRRPTTSPRPHTALSCVPEFDLRIPPLTSSSSSSVDLPSIYPPHSLDTMPSSPGMHEQMLPYIPEYSPLPQLSQHWQPTSPPPLDVPITSPADSSASPSPSFSPPHVRSASPIKRDSVVRGKSFNPGPTPLKAEFRVSFDPEKNVSPRSAAMPEVAYNSAISPSATGSHAHVNTDVKAPTASSYLPMQSLLTPITPPGDYGHNLGYPITAFPPNSMDMPPTFSDPWKQPSEVQYQHRHFNLDQPSPLDYSSPLVSRASFSSPPQEFYAFNQSPPPSRYANYTTHSSR